MKFNSNSFIFDALEIPTQYHLSIKILSDQNIYFSTLNSTIVMVLHSSFLNTHLNSYQCSIVLYSTPLNFFKNNLSVLELYGSTPIKKLHQIIIIIIIIIILISSLFLDIPKSTFGGGFKTTTPKKYNSRNFLRGVIKNCIQKDLQGESFKTTL